MSLKTLAKSLRRGEILIPLLKDYLRKQNELRKGKLLKRKDVVVEDAKLTIKCFKERIEDYNHGDFEDAELFHPSALGVCQRALWYDHKKVKVQHKSSDDLFKELMIFETGTYVGVVFQNLCERAGYLIRREVPIVDRKRKILGHADGELKIDGIKYVLEIKTINSRGFTMLQTANPSHVKQAHAYMRCLKRKWAIIVYLEKDRHAVKEFVIPYSHEYYLEHVRKRIRKHFRNIKRSYPPEKEYTNPNTFPCRFCAHKFLCYDTAANQRLLVSLRKLKETCTSMK